MDHRTDDRGWYYIVQLLVNTIMVITFNKRNTYFMTVNYHLIVLL
jgi:hypothetical protein